MKNASTSDQVINTTATDICDVLKNLSGGTYTIKINGEIDNETIIAINESLHKLNNLDTMINLDLSDTTSLVSIGNEAFYGCERLTSVTIPDSVTSIGNEVFRGCKSLTNFNVSTDNEYYSSSDCKILLNKNATTLIAYPSATGNIVISDNMTSIGAGAFCGCERLTSVTIPDSVTSIGDRAFCGCERLTSVTIPDSVISIGNEAFYGCESLTSVTIPNSVTSIGDWAFSGCKSLTSITISDSVTSIGNEAFNGCESLTTVNYRGTQEQWELVSIDNGNDDLTNATIIYNYTDE